MYSLQLSPCFNVFVCRLWVSRYRVTLRTKALMAEQDYQVAVDRLADVKRQEDLHVLRTAKVLNNWMK